MTSRAMRALVTGGSAGLGAAMVRWLMDKEFEVVVLDLDRPPPSHGPVEFIRCDLASRSQLDQILPDLIEAGPYDLVVLNAGMNATGRFESLDAQAHVDVLRVNAEAPMVIASRLLEAQSLKPGAAMVFVASLSHFTGYPGAASYAASKDALAIFAHSIRKVAKSRGVTITTAFPGPLRTAHAERHAPEGGDADKRMDPDLAASVILADALAGRKTSIPGRRNRLFALAGRMFPKPVTALVRRVIYDRLG